MTRRRLDAITVEGFTSIRSARVELGDINVLVGPNGAGKSNLIAALELLGRMTDKQLGAFVGRQGGAHALLHQGFEPAEAVRLQLEFGEHRYEAELTPGANDELFFVDEQASFDGQSDTLFGPSLGSGHRESLLSREARRGTIAAEVSGLLRGCRVYHFHDTSRTAPVKRLVSGADNIALRSDAGNLGSLLARMRSAGPAGYERLVRTVQQVAPFFEDFVLQEESEGRVRLRWRQQGSDAVLGAEALSDGTLRFICLTTLLHQPELPGLVVLDEPELGLHPYAIVQLAEMLRAVTTQSQVLIATQSVTLMNQFELDELIVVERAAGESVFSRPEPERLRDWLDEYSLGELWEKNILGGRPRAERG